MQISTRTHIHAYIHAYTYIYMQKQFYLHELRTIVNNLKLTRVTTPINNYRTVLFN